MEKNSNQKIISKNCYNLLIYWYRESINQYKIFIKNILRKIINDKNGGGGDAIKKKKRFNYIKMFKKILNGSVLNDGVVLPHIMYTKLNEFGHW